MIYYTNNSGTRWVDTNTQAMRFVLVIEHPDNTVTRRVRKAEYFSSFGNFGTIGYRYAGRWYEGMPKNHEGGETRVAGAKGQDALPHIWHKKSRRNSR